MTTHDPALVERVMAAIWNVTLGDAETRDRTDALRRKAIAALDAINQTHAIVELPGDGTAATPAWHYNHPDNIAARRPAPHSLKPDGRGQGMRACTYCGRTEPEADEPCVNDAAMSEHDSWDDPKYVKPADCDEDGYCVDCRSATVHRDGCIVLTSKAAERDTQ